MSQSQASRGEFGIWQAPGDARLIRYSYPVLEQIRLEVVEGYLALPRGGVETGGVLFGFREDNCVWITAARPVACEHAFGPGFLLSDKDEAALREQLSAPVREPRIGGLEPVGWYHSHTRSAISLNEADLALYHKYFPENWQIALVLRPDKAAPTRAGFFLREADGTVRADSPYEEFVVAPFQRSKRPAAREEKPPSPAPVPAAARPRGPAPVSDRPAAADRETPKSPVGISEPELASPRPSAAPGSAGPENGTSAKPRQAAEIRPLVTPASAPAHSPNSLRPVGGFEDDDEDRPRSRKWLWISVLFLAVVVGAGLLARSRAIPIPTAEAPSEPLSLKALDSGGQLVISWNRQSTPVRAAARGALEITDGNKPARIDLTAEQLHKGSFTYVRQTDRVDVRLIVPREGGSQPAEELVSFLGQLPAKPVAAAESATPDLVRERDEARREMERARQEAQNLRGALAKESARNRELEQAMRVLRDRLQFYESRRGRR